MLEVLRRFAVVAGASSMVIAATWFRFGLFDWDVSIPAIVVFVVGAVVFGRAYWAGTPEAPPRADADRWDRGVAWLAEHGAVPAVVALCVLVGVMFGRIFVGETLGDDLTFHMAESVRIADCIREGDWDLWNPSANAGYASAYYYQVLPQLASALPAALFDHHLFWFQLSLWLPQVLAPVAAYRGMRMMGATAWQSASAAFAVTFISGASRWGTGADGTFQVGLYTQTWALAVFPLGLGYGVRWLVHGDRLASAIGWGAFVFLCHPFASIALCAGLAFGAYAHSWRSVLRGRTILFIVRVIVLAVVVVAFVVNALGFATHTAIPPRPEGATEDLPAVWSLATASLYLGPMVLLAALGARLVRSLSRANEPERVDVPVGRHSISRTGNPYRNSATGTSTQDDGAPNLGLLLLLFALHVVAITGAMMAFTRLWLLAIPLAACVAVTAYLAWPLRREPIVRLFVIGGGLLLATLPGWLTLVVDLDGFGGFPHRVDDEVGPGYRELMRWYSHGALLDHARLVVLTCALPVVVVFARMRFAIWLWTPALVFAALLALGPHMPTTADDLLPAVRFLGAMQVVLALAIGAGVHAIGAAIWNLPHESRWYRAVIKLARLVRPASEPGVRYGLRTVVVAIACSLVMVLVVNGGPPLANRVVTLDSYDYREELYAMNEIIAQQPQGRKQVGPGCEHHWWNLLSFVYTRRPALLQMGGGGLQASPNYDFVWSVRDFPKLAWVYDTPLFLFNRDNAATAPAGDVLGQTARYELRRLPAPGIVSAVQVTGVLPEGPSRANSPVRVAAIDWLKSAAPMNNQVLAYHGHGEPGPAPDARVVRAFRVDPSPADTADIYADVEVARPTTFVVRESWHPRWHAYVDGIETAIRRVTPDFPAIDVAPGSHVLAFRFERPWWAHAAWLAWPGAVFAAWIYGRLRRPQSGS